jgi:hypothetical protein
LQMHYGITQVFLRRKSKGFGVLNLGILLFKKEVMIFRAGKLSSWQAHKVCVYGVRLLSLVWRKKELAILQTHSGLAANDP